MGLGLIQFFRVGLFIKGELIKIAALFSYLISCQKICIFWSKNNIITALDIVKMSSS